VPEDVRFGRTLVQFFLVPAIVVAACVFVFFFFAWLVSDEKTGVDYLGEIRMGSANRRWQAAFELSKIINMDSEKKRMEGLVPEMISPSKTPSTTIPVRHYLALLGHLGDQRRPRPHRGPRRRITTRLYASWALGASGTRVRSSLSRNSRRRPGSTEDAVYAAGTLGTSAILARSRSGTPIAIVSWNAAVALAQLGTLGESHLL
jgi:hypothetical protein